MVNWAFVQRALSWRGLGRTTLLAHRRYNSVRTNVLHCETVMSNDQTQHLIINSTTIGVPHLPDSRNWYPGGTSTMSLYICLLHASVVDSFTVYGCCWRSCAIIFVRWIPTIIVAVTELMVRYTASVITLELPGCAIWNHNKLPWTALRTLVRLFYGAYVDFRRAIYWYT